MFNGIGVCGDGPGVRYRGVNLGEEVKRGSIGDAAGRERGERVDGRVRFTVKRIRTMEDWVVWWYWRV